MSSQPVSIEKHGSVTVLSLDRPPANAIDLELAEAVETAFTAAMADEPRALVLTGTGRFFSAGLDLKTVPSYSVAQQRALLRAINRMLGALYGCPVPVVGGVNGHAVAGGFILALSADYRIGASGNFDIGLTEARVGIPFPAAPMIVLQAELAPQHARFITLYARNFGPDEARARGVFDELQPQGAVLERAMEVARDMASIPGDAYRRIKQQLRGAAVDRIAEINATDADPMLEGWVSADAPAAAASILGGAGQRTS
jgi:enoyl-CoA hydratase